MIGFLIQRFLIKFPNKKVLTSLIPNASVGLSSDASLLFLYILSCKNIYPLVMSLCPYISYLCRRAISPTGILHGCCTLYLRWDPLMRGSKFCGRLGLKILHLPFVGVWDPPQVKVSPTLAQAYTPLCFSSYFDTERQFTDSCTICVL